MSCATDSHRPALCSELSARRGLPLVGTAGFYDTVVAFELPAPWTARLAGSRASDDALDAAIASTGRDKRIRLLAIENDGTGRDESTVLVFRRTAGSRGRYSRSEHKVERPALAALLERVATGAEPSSSVDAGVRRDLLVCTHGARDACCGKFGFPLFRRFASEAANAPGLRVWRTSHLGGHRFAPTLLDLPSGRLYGRVGLDDVPAIVGGGPDLVSRLERLYRGCCALPEAAQIVERELWRAAGEAVEDAELDVRIRSEAAGFEVVLEARTEGSRFVAHAEVERSAVHSVETPASCGRDPEVEAPWTVGRMRVAEAGELDSVRGFS